MLEFIYIIIIKHKEFNMIRNFVAKYSRSSGSGVHKNKRDKMQDRKYLKKELHNLKNQL